MSAPLPLFLLSEYVGISSKCGRLFWVIQALCGGFFFGQIKFLLSTSN